MSGIGRIRRASPLLPVERPAPEPAAVPTAAGPENRGEQMSDIQTVTPVTGRDERFRPDQLVVDLPHLDLVMSELDELGAGAEAPEADDRLELALIQLADVGGAAGRLRER